MCSPIIYVLHWQCITLCFSERITLTLHHNVFHWARYTDIASHCLSVGTLHALRWLSRPHEPRGDKHLHQPETGEQRSGWCWECVEGQPAGSRCESGGAFVMGSCAKQPSVDSSLPVPGHLLSNLSLTLQCCIESPQMSVLPAGNTS